MKNLLPAGLLLASLLVSCGGTDQPAAETAAPDAPATAAASAAPALDVAAWQPTDLSKAVPEMPITLNLPAGAKLEKNGNGGVDAPLNDKVMLQASFQAVASLQEALTADEGYLLKDDMYTDARKLVTDPTGYVYTRRMKPEANGTTYEPETHFVYYVTGKDGAVYRISDERTADALMAPGSEYPEAQAKALYESVKKSIQVKS